MMRLVLALLLAVAVATPAMARPSVPIVDGHNQPIAAAATADAVRRAITAAAASRRWTLTGSGAGPHERHAGDPQQALFGPINAQLQQPRTG